MGACTTSPAAATVSGASCAFAGNLCRGTGWLSLSGIAFSVKENDGRLTLKNSAHACTCGAAHSLCADWQNYGGGYRPSQAVRIGEG